MRSIALAVVLVTLSGCQREQRNLRPQPARLVIFGAAAPESTLFPGGASPPPPAANPDYGNAYDISEGQRLFNWYNCSGCHANGGGGIGPPLIKQNWIYGGEPGNLFDTIVKGRPNGMPTWGAKIPENQIWQLVAYIRSLNGEQPNSATPKRNDTIEVNPQMIQNKVPGVTK